MPERPKRSSPLSDDGDPELEAVLDAARKALVGASGWTIEPCHYDSLRESLESIGHPCNDCHITIALRAVLSEIPKLRRRTDTSYAGLSPDQTLYECRWKSNFFKRMMYLKFAMNGELFELFRLHENVERNANEVH
jgi:hypothetical protein